MYIVRARGKSVFPAQWLVIFEMYPVQSVKHYNLYLEMAENDGKKPPFGGG